MKPETAVATLLGLFLEHCPKDKNLGFKLNEIEVDAIASLPIAKTTLTALAAMNGNTIYRRKDWNSSQVQREVSLTNQNLWQIELDKRSKLIETAAHAISLNGVVSFEEAINIATDAANGEHRYAKIKAKFELLPLNEMLQNQKRVNEDLS